MLRPVALDILIFLLPLCVGALVFWAGRSLRRWPRTLRLVIVTLAITAVAGGVASLAGLLSERASHLIYWAGGTTTVLSWAALLLLGVAWTTPGRRRSTGFLACLVAVAGCLVFIEASGPLWWRFCASDRWLHTPDAQGGLRQSTGWSCSPAAAVMLLHRYGISASEGEMAYLSGTSLFGTDAQGMAGALRKKVASRGWHALARHAGYDFCLRRGEPFIAHIGGLASGHAVLVEQVSAKKVDIVDPQDGAQRRLSRAEFEQTWDGTVIGIVRRAD